LNALLRGYSAKWESGGNERGIDLAVNDQPGRQSVPAKTDVGGKVLARRFQAAVNEMVDCQRDFERQSKLASKLRDDLRQLRTFNSSDAAELAPGAIEQAVRGDEMLQVKNNLLRAKIREYGVALSASLKRAVPFLNQLIKLVSEFGDQIKEIQSRGPEPPVAEALRDLAYRHATYHAALRELNIVWTDSKQIFPSDDTANPLSRTVFEVQQEISNSVKVFHETVAPIADTINGELEALKSGKEHITERNVVSSQLRSKFSEIHAVQKQFGQAADRSKPSGDRGLSGLLQRVQGLEKRIADRERRVRQGALASLQKEAKKERRRRILELDAQLIDVEHESSLLAVSWAEGQDEMVALAKRLVFLSAPPTLLPVATDIDAGQIRAQKSAWTERPAVNAAAASSLGRRCGALAAGIVLASTSLIAVLASRSGTPREVETREFEYDEFSRLR
jgi:gas vesicle protein